MRLYSRNILQAHIIAILLSAFLWLPSAAPLHAGELTGAVSEDRRPWQSLDSADAGKLTLGIKNIDFFQNNEYASAIVKGYTLPGLRLRPSVGYQPIGNILVEAGFEALVYRGAYRYPNLGYSDMPYWKGDQFQKGAHFVPFFRARADIGNVAIIIGDIYGGENHRLIRPLYDPELLFTADPEAGLQILWATKRFSLDAWIDWRSFIFKDDGHQESFVFGGSIRYDVTPRDSRLNFYIPAQITGQHRGGEIDTITSSSVQTLINGAIGVGTDWRPGHRGLSSLSFEASLLGYYQQAGELWPFDSGSGFYVEARATLLRDFYLTAGLFHSKKFISILGSPFFGNVSSNGEMTVFPRMTTCVASVEYRRTFARDFTLGLRGDLYFSDPGNGKETLSSNSLTAYLRIDLDFLLWHKKR